MSNQNLNQRYRYSIIDQFLLDDNSIPSMNSIKNIVLDNKNHISLVGLNQEFNDLGSRVNKYLGPNEYKQVFNSIQNFISTKISETPSELFQEKIGPQGPEGPMGKQGAQGITGPIGLKGFPGGPIINKINLIDLTLYLGESTNNKFNYSIKGYFYRFGKTIHLQIPTINLNTRTDNQKFSFNFTLPSELSSKISISQTLFISYEYLDQAIVKSKQVIGRFIFNNTTLNGYAIFPSTNYSKTLLVPSPAQSISAITYNFQADKNYLYSIPLDFSNSDKYYSFYPMVETPQTFTISKIFKDVSTLEPIFQSNVNILTQNFTSLGYYKLKSLSISAVKNVNEIVELYVTITDPNDANFSLTTFKGIADLPRLDTTTDKFKSNYIINIDYSMDNIFLNNNTEYSIKIFTYSSYDMNKIQVFFTDINSCTILHSINVYYQMQISGFTLLYTQ